MINKVLKMIICFFKYIYYSLYTKIKRIDNKDIWLISERGVDARDNAYFFYKYLIDNNIDNVKYVISSNSPDMSKIKKEHIVLYGSKEHYILFKTAGKLISTHIMGYSPNMSLFWRLDKIGILKLKGQKIMLQHGITKDYIDMFKEKNSKLDLFICGAKPEYDYLLNNFGYSKKEIKYTGFARYDNLQNIKVKNQILVMPTFRKWLNHTKDFKESEYYQKWNNLINNDELINYLEKNNIDLVFYPHYEIQKYINLFKSKSKNVIIASFDDYDVQKLLIESKLLITDYSSVFFDFVYMDKPVIYYTFDIDKLREKHYKEGYFKYSKNAFGKILTDQTDIVNKIISYDKMNYKIEKFYKMRIDNFFSLKDKNNCDRIYKEIINL